MKKSKNIEMRIYELLGVKIFRRIAFAIRDNLWTLSNLKMPKEERKYYLYHTASNYNLGKVKSLEDIKKFKKLLYLNAGVHIFGLSLCIPFVLKIVGGTAYLSTTIITFTCIGINLYCIMLQRYNNIRINQIIKKMTPRYERQKDTIKEELKQEDSLFEDHTYKIVNKKEKETNISFNDLITNATIEQLIQYREYLKKFSQAIKENEYYDESQIDISMPIEKNKILKLELKNNKQGKKR